MSWQAAMPRRIAATRSPKSTAQLRNWRRRAACHVRAPTSPPPRQGAPLRPHPAWRHAEAHIENARNPSEHMTACQRPGERLLGETTA